MFVFLLIIHSTFHYEIKPHVGPIFFWLFRLSSVLPPVKEWTNVNLINIDKLFHEMSSGMEKWTRPWREIESRMVRVRQNANASMAKGITCTGKAEKQILCTSISHSSLQSSLFFPLFVSLHLHLLYPSITLSGSFFYCWISKMTAHKTPWNRTPPVLINASLASKMIISRWEWVLDGWRNETNELKISFLTKVSFYCAISQNHWRSESIYFYLSLAQYRA